MGISVFRFQVDTAAPLSVSLAAGGPSVVKDHQPSFVDGMGGKALFPAMWPMASGLLSGAFSISLQVHVSSRNLHSLIIIAGSLRVN